MRTSAMAALVLALPLFAAGGTSEALAGGWCDRPVAYYGAPYSYRYGYRYGYAPAAPYYYGYGPRVVGYGPSFGYRDRGWRRGGFFFGLGW
jgi:hypothetical protein